MPVTHGFRDFVIDQLSGLGDVRPRAMFGGVGLYLEEHFFALLADDVLYLKTDDGNRRLYEAAGSTPFKPYPDRPETMQYYNVPLRVLEDVDTLAAWAAAALAAARRKPGSKRKRKT